MGVRGTQSPLESASRQGRPQATKVLPMCPVCTLWSLLPLWEKVRMRGKQGCAPANKDERT